MEIYLKAEGYQVEKAYNGQEALACVEREEIHLVLMDIMMPGLDGISATIQLRRASNVPVILITAKSEDTDKVLGLNLGADDYITKPFNPVEVMARVRSQLRRYAQLGGMEQKPTVLQIGGIRLDDEAKAVTLDGDPVALTPIEYSILRLLMSNPGKVYSRDELLETIWGFDYIGDFRTVDVHIRRLREKIEADPANPSHIMTKWGVGYYFAQ